MPRASLDDTEIFFKLVYVGPDQRALHGNLVAVARAVGAPIDDPSSTDGERWLLEVSLGTSAGVKTVMVLSTVPERERYPGPWMLVLKDADGVVFVADDRADAAEANMREFKAMRDLLAELCRETYCPIVIQRSQSGGDGGGLDASGILAGGTWPVLDAVVSDGVGTTDTLKSISRLALTAFREQRRATR